jgi:metal-responsive CopG/Arc/MetJ family transcriptional regulator
MDKTTISIPKELARRIDRQSVAVGSSRSSYANLLLRNALDVVEKHGISNLISAKNHEQGLSGIDQRA